MKDNNVRNLFYTSKCKWHNSLMCLTAFCRQVLDVGSKMLAAQRTQGIFEIHRFQISDFRYQISKLTIYNNFI